MAKQDRKYAVPVATRIDADLAHEFGKRAAIMGVSLSSYLAIFLSRAHSQLDNINHAEEELRLEKDYSKTVIGRFITEIGKTPEERVKLVQLFNKISADVRATKDLFRP